MKTFVFDIDGTICTLSNGDYENAMPISYRINKINKLYNEGNTIIFNTARGMGRYKNDASQAHAALYDITIKQLNNWCVKYHKLFMGKPSGDIYIDDKGVNDEDFFKD